MIIALLRRICHLLERVIELLSPMPAAGFRIGVVLKGDEGVKKATDATLDFTVFENGQATATLTPVDKDGTPTEMPAGASIPVWTSSDPGITVSSSLDGMSALLTAGNAPVQMAVISASATLADANSTVITGSTEPIDVVAQPPSSPVAFKIALSVPAGV